MGKFVLHLQSSRLPDLISVVMYNTACALPWTRTMQGHSTWQACPGVINQRISSLETEQQEGNIRKCVHA